MASWEIVDKSWAPDWSNVSIDPVGPKGFGKCAILVKRPSPKITSECFEFVTKELPETLDEGSVLVQHLVISMDPTHILWMNDMPQYMPAVGLNTIMRGFTIGKVIKTTDEEKMPIGSLISCFGGIAEYSMQAIGGCNPLVPDVPLTWNFGPFSLLMGHTAWVGYKICAPTPGCTFVVSGAAGAVGCLAGQLAKIAGAKVVGIAGGEEKCRYVTEELGFDACIDYKKENVKEGLQRVAPEGIDCYFDNVGGEILDTVMGLANVFCRIAFCGSISEYQGDLLDGVSKGPSNYKLILMKRMKVQGYVCIDHLASVPEAYKEIGKGIEEGKIKWKEDIREGGIKTYVDTINLLYNGGNKGKLMLKLVDY